MLGNVAISLVLLDLVPKVEAGVLLNALKSLAMLLKDVKSNQKNVP